MASTKPQNNIDELIAAVLSPPDPNEVKQDDVDKWVATIGLKSGNHYTTVHTLHKYYKEWSVAPYPKDVFSKSLKKHIAYEETKGFLIDDNSLEPARQQLLRRIGERRRGKKTW